MENLFKVIHTLPGSINYYLESMVFPEVLVHQKLKLSASGQELGGDILFKKRYGFSGTPSDLLPIELGKCGYEEGSEGKVMTTLIDERVVTYTLPKTWTVKQLLKGCFF